MVGLFGPTTGRELRCSIRSFGDDDGSWYRKRIERESEHFVDIKAMTTEAVGKRIHDDGVHILVDLKGHTGQSRLDILALRPAAYSGGRTWMLFVTLISSTMCWATDRHASVDAGAYREKLVLLPHTYFMIDHEQATPTPRRRGRPRACRRAVLCSLASTTATRSARKFSTVRCSSRWMAVCCGC